MDDFGSILYIVFTIIAIVFSIMKKSNQKAKPMVPPEYDDDNESFDEVAPAFERLFGGENVAPQTRKIVVAGPVEKKEVINDFEAKKREMESRLSKIQRTGPAQVEKKGEVIKEGVAWFNLREAVIYSEILKRPNL